ncbi:hypothetical protein [Microbacterium karelineae]|uniref:hypothetical protein n=1 Tax=Microbacterium karelineae TaxID=2654283 RepID=UPI0012EA4CAD|nr:hypothetical protein [Microbacterium karelineae]
MTITKTSRAGEPRGICPPDHAHGATSTCYLGHRCGCDECREACRARELARRTAIAFGRYERRVPVEPVRERVRHLIAAGVQLRTIERGTGTSLTTVMYGPGPQKTIAAATARRVLEYLPSLDDYADRSTIDARGARRRVQALVALGWTLSAVAKRAGLSGPGVSDLTRAGHCWAGTARAIRDVYEEMSMSLPPAETRIQRRDVSIAKSMARREGWVPPLAWDDIDVDPRPAEARQVEAAAA